MEDVMYLYICQRGEPGGESSIFHVGPAFGEVLQVKAHQSDKLIASSGLAQQMQTQLIDTYVVGLWTSNLPSQLLSRVEAFTLVIIFEGGGMNSRNHPVRRTPAR